MLLLALILFLSPGVDTYGWEMYGYTQNIYVQDLTNKRIFYRGYKNLSIRYINLKKLSFDQSRFIPIDRSFMDGAVDTTANMTSIKSNVVDNTAIP